MAKQNPISLDSNFNNRTISLTLSTLLLPTLPPNFTTRPATPADAEAVTACVNAAYAQWVAVIGKLPGPMLENYAEVLARG